MADALKKKLKIGLLCDDSLDKTDGVQQYVLCLGAWLANNGHEVHYLTSTTERTDLPNVHNLSKNVPVRFNSNRGGMPLPASPKRIKELLEREQFDVLHVQMPYSPLLAGQVIQYAGPDTSIIGTFHIFPQSQLVSAASHVLGFAMKWQLKRFELIMSVSSAAQDFATYAFGIDSVIVPNMVDTQRFSAAKSKKSEVITVAFLGRLVERKGCRQLLEAINYLQKHYKTTHQYRVIIGGKGPLKTSLEEYAKVHNLQEVTFAGFVSEEDKPEFLASADIAIFPSTGGESFGISLVEAMAATDGVVLAGDNAGYRTVMEGSKKQLVKPYDTANFAHILATYIDDKKRRDSAQNWQKKHVQQYDTENVAPKVLDYYRDSLHKRHK